MPALARAACARGVLLPCSACRRPACLRPAGPSALHASSPPRTPRQIGEDACAERLRGGRACAVADRNRHRTACAGYVSNNPRILPYSATGRRSRQGGTKGLLPYLSAFHIHTLGTPLPNEGRLSGRVA